VATLKLRLTPDTKGDNIIMKVKISLRALCQIALLIALAFVLERLVPVVSLPAVRISFTFIPMMCCGMLFGPVWGAAAYGITDILGWPIMGLQPIPLILLSRIVNGLIFGLILHRKNLKFWPHGVLSAVLVQLICGAGLSTLGLAQWQGVPYLPLLAARAAQFAAFIVLQLAAFPLLLRLRDALRKSGLVTV
jgi:ECF transporter S component (folate family)